MLVGGFVILVFFLVGGLISDVTGGGVAIDGCFVIGFLVGSD